MFITPNRTPRLRRLLRALALFVGLFAVIGVAMFGAVLAFAVLAAGTLVHFALRGAGAQPAAGLRRSSARVIDGEFTVVERPGTTNRVLSARHG